MNLAIAEDHVVTLHYRLTLDDGSIADESFGGEPLVYLHGHNNIVPGLEKQLAGKVQGDNCEVTVAPGEGYGEYDPTLDQTAPRSAFPPDAQLAVGMAFQARGPRGQPVTLWIRSIKGDDVVVTPNHPLAGQALNFKVEIVEVRAATADEKKHGHVHGPGGHHH
ncbi:MAG: peptidylprolyl isomerase [Planctomycetes bacterium]|nr:peptidylprolyl isomerase [Planctomycetota bacterium]